MNNLFYKIFLCTIKTFKFSHFHAVISIFFWLIGTYHVIKFVGLVFVYLNFLAGKPGEIYFSYFGFKFFNLG